MLAFSLIINFIEMVSPTTYCGLESAATLQLIRKEIIHVGKSTIIIMYTPLDILAINGLITDRAFAPFLLSLHIRCYLHTNTTYVNSPVRDNVKGKTSNKHGHIL